MKFSKIKSGLKVFCCWALLLQLINLSIDPVRHQNFINDQITFDEDLSVNKIESFYELILESVFNKEVPETQNHTFHSFTKTFIVFYQEPTLLGKLILAEKPVLHNYSYFANFPELTPVLESPPPKV